MELIIKRSLALVIDLILVNLISKILSFALVFMYPILLIVPFIGGWLFKYGLLFIILFAYNLIMEVLYEETLGKKILKLKIKNDGDTGSLLLRNLIKALSITSFYNIFALISLVYMVAIDPSSSIHDKLAGTSVWTK